MSYAALPSSVSSAAFFPKTLSRRVLSPIAFLSFRSESAAMETFVASVGEVLAGFCSIRLLSPIRAELLYLYVSSDCRGIGVGSRLVRHAEQRVSSAHPELAKFFLDTAVPEYNQSLWEHMGYRPVGTSFCDYPTGKIPAVRLEKRMDELGVEEGPPNNGLERTP